ncbi:MAG: hypothetical protein AAF696_29625 [Bacteroidota bacterium]
MLIHKLRFLLSMIILFLCMGFWELAFSFNKKDKDIERSAVNSLNYSLNTLADSCGPDLIGWKDMEIIFLENGCQSCHGGNRAAGGMDFSSYASTVIGGNKCGPDILTGTTLNDIITTSGYNGCGRPINGASMNDRVGGAVDSMELASIQAWIDAGAPEACDCRADAVDTDNDGVCDVLDTCPNFDNNLIGTACDDGLACTINDVWGTDCKCQGTPTQSSCDELEVFAFLEGPFQQDSMGAFLSANIGLTDPYLGTESVSQLPPNVVDWILVQLRDSADNKNILAQKAAFITAGGRIIGSDAGPKLSFDVNIPNFAYVALLHRNHLGIMTEGPVDLSQSLDFRNPSTGTFGLNAQKMINTKAVMIAGDANADGTVNAVDKNSYWRVQNGNPFNYNDAGGDMNMDGTTNAVDINGYWRINNSRFAQLPD